MSAIPGDILNAASMAAFPGLPDGMSLDEANRRVAAALETTWPLIEQYWRLRIAGEITAAGSPVRLEAGWKVVVDPADSQVGH
ncbi:hypothetical protein Caci_2937 [Catenulispora acidiphila DSM 44928]|uniref:Uncharacterized protein n=1 Tax=Catenulispora acidiphila (strain DSM 44928 / JCM 14897 / NBRC 102108 / NRRL B-24433 / ID139908) TaxID=479433 RepID=C7Q2V4_CATAD|nr:hypothetical protein [Catenulispora acidiphila]ACU71846.1 hypothetical protein Caci_2937 [Catenulispora acidiphila DSM 44928]